MKTTTAEEAAKLAFRMPTVKILHDFNYQPIGPFWVIGDEDQYFALNIKTITEAFNLFVRYGMPSKPGVTKSIMDSDGVVVIGYSLGSWYGLRAGFDVYRDHRLTHPLEYELAAKEAEENAS